MRVAARQLTRPQSIAAPLLRGSDFFCAGVIKRIPGIKRLPFQSHANRILPTYVQAHQQQANVWDWGKKTKQKQSVGESRSNIIINNEPTSCRSSVSCCVSILLRQVAVSNLIGLVGTLVVHYRHSDSFPSNSVPVWVCALGSVAVLTGLVLHQVLTFLCLEFCPALLLCPSCTRYASLLM